MKTVYVIGNERAYVSMFQYNGWETVDHAEYADFVQFTGGSDVSPMLYGESKHYTTGNNPARDDFEADIFFNAVKEGKNLLGICRGAQFLNVMSGGEMWQHVDNHAVAGGHVLKDLSTRDLIPVSSTHHQMMRSSEDARVIANAHLSTRKEGDTHHESNPKQDEEVVWYEHTKSLCFQPHPEFFTPDHPCQTYYFNLINRMFGE